jgi:predicted outer membrane repeat protein
MEMDAYILFSKLTVLLLLNNAVLQYARCDKINIIPTAESSCPSAIKGVPCFTLQQYIANPSLGSDITLEVYPGNHRIDSHLLVSDINSFTMRASKTASVSCSQQLQPGDYYWLSFTRVQTVNICGIDFNGCSIWLSRGPNYNVTNATFVSSSFINKTGCTRAVLDIDIAVSVRIERCIFSNNKEGCAAISSASYGGMTIYQSTFENNNDGGAIRAMYGAVSIHNSTFSNNKGSQGGAVSLSTGIIADSYFNGNVADGNGGAVWLFNTGTFTITNSHFTNNTAGSRSGHGGAVYVLGGTSIINNSYFSNNVAPSVGSNGGAIYAQSEQVTVTNGYFSGNIASGHGGAIVTSLFVNVAISSSTFVRNAAIAGGGGAIHCDGQNASIILLTNNTFSHNTAAYCGVMDVDDLYHCSANIKTDPYHCSANIVGNTFTHNRAVGQVAGNNGGGVICIGNASVSVLDNKFSHNSAAGDAGVLLVDESDVTVKTSIFSNNTAGGNGGVYFYPTSYTITQTSFTNNQAGGDGGVMYVGRAGSQVRIRQTTFGVNRAAGRGGAIAIAGSTLYINTASIYGNTAKLGGVANACKSNVRIANPKVRAKPDPVYKYCTLYDSSNTTFSQP